jgi:hypothetical protein
MPFFPLVIVVHVALAVTLFLPSILLPLALRAGAPGPAAGRITRGLLTLQGTGSLIVGAGLAVTGILLVAGLGLRIVEEPWLLAALVVYAANLVLAFAIQRPNIRRLVRQRGGGDERTWRDRAVRYRYVSYAMAGLVGVIAWLMTTKPNLW